MEQREVPRERLQLRDNPELLLPPTVVEPLYQCAKAVTVTDFIPHAKIRLRVNGAIVATVQADFPLPNGVSISLATELTAGQTVSAQQISPSGLSSSWSTPVTVRNHTQDYPAGPPRPVINPSPVYECGVRTGVSNLLTGGNVWITANGVEVGRVNGCQQHQGVNVSPAYGLSQRVRAWFELCRDQAPPSEEQVTTMPPSPLPTPGFEPVITGAEQITINNIVNGARVTLYRNGVNQGTWPCWGGSILIGLNPPYSAGETLTASQVMCPGSPPSPPGTTTVLPCNNLPAPTLAPLQAGDTSVTLASFVPGATIKVYVNGVQAGIGGGPVIWLNVTLRRGDTVHVVQDLIGCNGRTAREIRVDCVNPPITYDPSSLNLFPVGFRDYSSGRVKGSVFYPAEDDGANKPFNRRMGQTGRVPIVFMAHGNHATRFNPRNRLDEACETHAPAGWNVIPNYKGYDYFQKSLAKMGIIAVSIDCNATNCKSFGVTNLEERADLIIESIKYFQQQDANNSSPFFQRIDFAQIGLMGHSRGGDAVVLVPEVVALPGVRIKGVIALAPTDQRGGIVRPTGFAFMTILPAGDGDVISNDGAKFYDKASPSPFKSQLYVHFANHNFFNREWPKDDSLPDPMRGFPGAGPAVMARWDHERILLTYGGAFFRRIILNHSALERFLSGHEKPAIVLADNVHLSFEKADQTTVDNHENGNGIGLNSMNMATTQSGGLSANEYPFRQVMSGAYNHTFFGNSIGMVASPGGTSRQFRSEIGSRDLRQKEIWIRVAEVSTEQGSLPSNATGFQLGLEDSSGNIAWVDSDEVGGVPRPYPRPSYQKTMLKTLRFKTACFTTEGTPLNLRSIKAILIRCNRRDQRALAFDDLQIINA